MKLLFTIDTEADNQWVHGCELSVKNIQAVPRLQNLCNKYKIKPTYLVTYEICTDDFSKEIFKEYIDSGRAEIGAHLHSWTTPPYLDIEGYRFNDVHHSFLSEMPADIMREKIKNLTSRIEDSFEIKPLSFRSGRYGFNGEIAHALVDHSYLVDSSVTPFTSWSRHTGLPGGKGGPDFIDKTPEPRYYHFENGSLMEIPATILPTRYPLNSKPGFAKYYYRNVNRNILLKAVRKFWLKRQPVWLRPFEWTNIEVFEEIVNEAEKLKLPYIVMWLHSSELMPGTSIYWRDENAINRLFRLLEQFFTLVNSKNIESVTMKEAALNCTE
ncbi:MAG: hypothetical protein IT214_04580 [Chitinophagaceae bacterium]|nr:hypothetical protein [Chitinophagaceae bacterium]